MKDVTSTKSKIQTTALRLFVEKGINEATIRDLAREAGIAEGTIYRHYVSKEELVSDLFELNYFAYGRRLNELQEKESGFRAKLRVMIADICQLFDTDPTMFRFLLLVQHQALPTLPKSPESPVDVLRKVVAEAVKFRELRIKNADLATAIVLGIVLQPATFAIYERLSGSLSRHATAITEACLRALQAEGRYDRRQQTRGSE